MSTHLVWDWNGTLFHDIDAVIEATNASFAELGLPAITAERYRELYCVPVPKFYERLIGRLPSDAEWEVMDATFHRYYWALAETCGLTTGAAELLAARRAAGMTQSLCSLAPHDQLVPIVAAHGIAAQVIRLDGAVEISVQLGLADAIADVVDSGRSLRQHGLVAFGDVICASEAVLLTRMDGEVSAAAKQLASRLQGVVFAQQYLMLDYDCPLDLLQRTTAITPGLESPTVSPLRDSGWSAVRAMVPRADTNRVMDELYDVGARAILVTEIHACRL